MILDAVNIQLGALEPAFKFRQANAVLYGFEKGSLPDGYLQKVEAFENIPEFWTSYALGRKQALIPTRVKELIEVSKEMAKLLGMNLEDYIDRQDEGRELEDGQVEIDPDRTIDLATKLRGSAAPSN